ncbi:band 3 anion transport protein-like isoform X3 [Styela clava]
MASGIDGPGVGDSPQQMHISPIAGDKVTADPVRFQVSYGDGMSYTPAATSTHHDDVPAVTVSEPMDSHLSFANLMSMQDQPESSDVMRQVYSSPILHSNEYNTLRSATRRVESFQQDSRRQSSEMRGSSAIPVADMAAAQRANRRPSGLADEIDKVLDEASGTTRPYAEPLKLQLDFGDPDIASEVSNYNDQRYNDADYSSHRRSQRHHSKPLAAHLSSHDMKSIKSRAAAAAALSGSDKEKKKSRRRHRSSSSSSSHGSTSKSPGGGGSDLLPAERKIKRKEKKKKKNVRKSLTGPLRQRTLSIPEEEEDDEEFMRHLDDDLEEEDESEEEEEEEEEEDSDKGPDDRGEERHDDDKGGDSNHRKPEDDDDDYVRKVNEVSTPAGTSTDVVDAGKEKMKVGFSIGDDDGERPASVLTVPSILSSKASPSGHRKSKTATFKLGEESEEDVLQRRHSATAIDEKKKKKKHRHSHHKRGRHSSITISQRRASGKQLRDLDEMKEEKMRRQLNSEADEDIRSHRYEHHAGIRKHLLHRPVKKRRVGKLPETQIPMDRRPHEVFVELDELVSGEWKETARWIKFEEDVEESQQWGKPRVASLSFHSLLELRKTIEKGAVVLDLAHDNLTDIANAVVEQMVQSDQIRADDRGSVLKVLLSKHKNLLSKSGERHLPSKSGFSTNFSTASLSSFFNPSSTGLDNMDDEESSVSYSTATQEPKIPLLDGDSFSEAERGRSGSVVRPPHSSQSAKDLKIMKKIPQDAEATAVLVGSLKDLEQPTMAFVRLAAGVDLENVVALPIPIRFLFILLGPITEDFDYHEIGRSISTLMADEEFHVVAYQAETRGDLLRAINEFLDDSIVLPPGQLENPELLKNIDRYQKHLAQRNKRKQLKAIAEKKEPEKPPEDPLKRTKKCFGGLVRDVKRRYPKYWSDIRDAFNAQCLASFIFIYFAALSPAITFGGLLGEKTGNLIGVSEMVLGCCACGCIMALFSGQPMLIVGATGPLLVFEEAVYGFCVGNGLPVLATRFWIGCWICIIAIVTVAFEGSFLIRFVSRFTQEIFAVLISLIFIYETFNKLFKIYGQHPLMASYCNLTVNSCNNSVDNMNTTDLDFNLTMTAANTSMCNNGTSIYETTLEPQPNTALLSTLLMFGTYIIAMQLREFRNSKFLRSSVRRTIGDFGVPIAIFVMVLFDYLIKETETQKLSLPGGISPTDTTQRGWLVNPFVDEYTGRVMPVWMIFAASLPAFLVFILIFMESHITELIVSKKERCLKKGTGFHLNLLVLGMVNCLVSAFGMPWVCAAAVRSITHTNSLTVMSQTQAPGEKPKIEATLEQRVTCFLVNAALGLSILMAPILKEIPIAVLFGIFLYMGVTSLTGVQFVDRMELLFMPSKHYPDCGYVNAVRPFRIHIFTIIEIVCLAILWVVKSTSASIAFPFFLLLTVPLRRFLLPKIFTDKELQELDG